MVPREDLPPFQAAVEEGDAYGVMAAYNKVQGSWCAENDMLLNRILRNEWGFAGLVVSDWGGSRCIEMADDLPCPLARMSRQQTDQKLRTVWQAR